MALTIGGKVITDSTPLQSTKKGPPPKDRQPEIKKPKISMAMVLAEAPERRGTILPPPAFSMSVHQKSFEETEVPYTILLSINGEVVCALQRHHFYKTGQMDGFIRGMQKLMEEASAYRGE